MNLAPEAKPYFPDYPATNPRAKNTAQIKRGEYLVKAGDCIACHTNTPEKGPVFAGGLPMPTPFGTIYTPNITSDKNTGIGNWTDAQFIKAMRKGISPEGKYYYPAFPYLYFSKITDEDLLAIKAYLDNIPAVNQANRDNTMMWPFNWRFLQLGWRLLFFNGENVGVYKTNPHQSTEINRGAYLTQGLGHCSMCHTPSYYLLTPKLPLAAPMQKYDLTGMQVQGYLAPNICKSNLGTTTTADIVDVFTKDKMIGGGKIEGPMLEVNHDSLRYLSTSDLSAIANYIKSVKSQSPPKPKGGPGKGTYETYCAGCHATGAGGAPKYGDAAAWDPKLKVGMDKVYANAINGIGGMPAKGACLSCTTEEIKQAVDYMAAAVTGATIVNKVVTLPTVKPLSMEDGKRIYTKNCSSCHNTGTNSAPKVGNVSAWKAMVDAGFLATYATVAHGKHKTITKKSCHLCSDAELIAAIKYMMQQSAVNKNYELW